jgi:hypothetical protein
MARPTRLGRPRRWPPLLFFKLIAVGLRPIDRHPAHARPAVQLCADTPSATWQGYLSEALTVLYQGRDFFRPFNQIREEKRHG